MGPAVALNINKASGYLPAHMGAVRCSRDELTAGLPATGLECRAAKIRLDIQAVVCLLQAHVSHITSTIRSMAAATLQVE